MQDLLSDVVTETSMSKGGAEDSQAFIRGFSGENQVEINVFNGDKLAIDINGCT